MNVCDLVKGWDGVIGVVVKTVQCNFTDQASIQVLWPDKGLCWECTLDMEIVDDR